MPTEQWLTAEEMLNVHSSVLQSYGGNPSHKTLHRDLATLVKDELLLTEGKKYLANIGVLKSCMAQSTTD